MFDSSVGFNFFLMVLFFSFFLSFFLLLFLRYLTFLFLRDFAPSSRRFLHPSSASPSISLVSFSLPTARESNVLLLLLTPRLFAPYPFASSPFCALHRSCAHALPCFSRHFSPSQTRRPPRDCWTFSSSSFRGNNVALQIVDVRFRDDSLKSPPFAN